MRKVLTTLALTGISVFGIAQEARPLLDSIHVFNAEPTSEEWIFAERIVNHYDDVRQFKYSTVEKLDESGKRLSPKSKSQMLESNSERKERIMQVWNEDKQNWDNDKRFLQNFDENGRRTSLTNQVLQDGEWQDQFERITNYNDKNLLSEEIHRFYNEVQDKFTVNDRTTFTYSDKGKLLIKLDQKGPEDGGTTWQDEVKNKFQYTDSGQLKSSIVERWDAANERWQYSYTDVYVYDVNQRLVEIQTDFKYNETGSLKGGKKTNYTYDTEGRQIGRTIAYWKNELNGWYLYSKNWYDYAASGRLTEEGSLRFDQAGKELDGHKIQYEFDENQKKTAYRTLNWRNGDWIMTVDQKFLYNEEGLQTQAFFQQWNDQDGELLYNRRFDRFWSYKTAEASELAEDNATLRTGSSSQCSLPNPYIIGSSIYCTELEADQSYQLRVYDMSGKQLSQQLFRGSDPVSVNDDLSAGLYIFKITSPLRVVATHKVVIQ